MFFRLYFPALIFLPTIDGRHAFEPADHDANAPSKIIVKRSFTNASSASG